jgi:hypothetical protein
MPDAAHLHLAINHAPLYAELFAFVILVAGLIWRKRDLVMVGLLLVIVGAIAAFAADQTGDRAAHMIKQGAPIAGLDTKLIKEHDQSAGYFLTAALITGGLAILSLIISKRRGGGLGWLDTLIAVAALLSFVIAARTALLGGRIHHPEVRPAAEGGSPVSGSS